MSSSSQPVFHRRLKFVILEISFKKCVIIGCFHGKSSLICYNTIGEELSKLWCLEIVSSIAVVSEMLLCSRKSGGFCSSFCDHWREIETISGLFWSNSRLIEWTKCSFERLIPSVDWNGSFNEGFELSMYKSLKESSGKVLLKTYLNISEIIDY